jgi:hypothetical protein
MSPNINQVLEINGVKISLYDILGKSQKIIEDFKKTMDYKEIYAISKFSWFFIKELGVSISAENDSQLDEMLNETHLFISPESSLQRNITISASDIAQKSKRFMDYLQEKVVVDNIEKSPMPYIITKAIWVNLKESGYAMAPHEEAQLETIIQVIIQKFKESSMNHS